MEPELSLGEPILRQLRVESLGTVGVDDTAQGFKGLARKADLTNVHPVVQGARVNEPIAIGQSLTSPSEYLGLILGYYEEAINTILLNLSSQRVLDLLIRNLFKVLYELDNFATRAVRGREAKVLEHVQDRKS